MNLKKLVKKLTAANDNHVVKIRYLKKPRGYCILYFDYRTKSSRQKYYPGLKMSLSHENDVNDEKVLLYAISLRDIKEDNVMSGKPFSEALDHNDKDIISIPEYTATLLENKKPKNASLYRTAINSFLAIFPDVSLSNLSSSHAKAYQSKISKLSPTTQRHYIRSMSYLCQSAIKDGLLKANPFESIKIKASKPVKNFLTIEEIKAVMQADCSNEVVKRAFIFSCFTGLRIGDIEKLDSSMLQDGYLLFQQNKTGSHEKIKLSDIAIAQLPQEEGRLFNLPAYKNCRMHLANLIANAGITKRITFHCARHTFATMCLTLGIDIFTVSKLLGHSDVRVTQIYAKLIDQVKDNAVAKLNTEWE